MFDLKANLKLCLFVCIYINHLFFLSNPYSNLLIGIVIICSRRNRPISFLINANSWCYKHILHIFIKELLVYM